MTTQEFKDEWRNEPEFHIRVHENFTDLVNGDPVLKPHRDYVDNHIFGMGERSFQYLWKIIMAELPIDPVLLEIGVFKGQIISLWKLLRPDAKVYGITPLDGRGTGWTEDDYGQHIKNIHNHFNLDHPRLLIGASQNIEIAHEAALIAPFDIVYIDGDHSYEGASDDLAIYSPMVKSGGYLVIDDAACNLNFPPSGFFTGIDTVTLAMENWKKTQVASEFEFMFNVVHLMVFKRK